ncbi:MAG: hypothetical protein KDB46_01740 [Solirubrobacterales bacterium]|nr:hypothetical protein [Solirubrobacterales bacterium]
MAARRLIIVLLVLFAVSIVAAMIAPERKGPLLGDRTSSSTTNTSSTTTDTTAARTDSTAAKEPTTRDTLPSGEALTVRIDASEKSPETVEAFVGDQLELNVGSERAREVEIPAFGVTEDAAPDAPANFNLLLREPGKLPIIDADTGVLLGRLDVEERRGKGQRGGKGAGSPGD